MLASDDDDVGDGGDGLWGMGCLMPLD